MKLRNKKTGKIIDFECITIFEPSFNAGTCESIDEFYTIDELNENWEDYKPKEPLIKNEKIRKAVRAWAEALGIERVSYSCTDGEFYSGDNCIRLGMVNRPEPIKSDTYTIAELCGEEE